MKVKVQLIGVGSTRFSDGTVRDSLDAKMEDGDVVKLWATNEAAESVAALEGAPMGTAVELEIALTSRDGKAGVKLLGAALVKGSV